MRSVNVLRYDPQTRSTHLIGLNTECHAGKPLEILEEWANTFGLGILGSHTAFQNRLAIRQKIPILIDPYRQVYFFPTITPSSADCLWINAAHIRSIKSKGLSSEIRFTDSSSLMINIGRRSLMKQWKRCQTMEHLIQKSRLEDCGYSAILLP